MSVCKGVNGYPTHVRAKEWRDQLRTKPAPLNIPDGVQEQPRASRLLADSSVDKNTELPQSGSNAPRRRSDEALGQGENRWGEGRWRTISTAAQAWTLDRGDN